MDIYTYLRFIYILLVLSVCIKKVYYNVDNKLPKILKNQTQNNILNMK